MRLNLKKQRLQQGFYKQEDFAVKIGISASSYNLLELGKRNTTLKTWRKIQKELKIKDSDMWNVINKDKE